jgi:anti-sigma B factor antagonist
MSSLQISIRQREAVTVVALAGSADMDEAMQLSRELQQLFARGQYHVVFDLRDLAFTCSMGLGTLIKAHNECRDHQGQMALAGPQPPVLKVFRTTRLDKLFPIYDQVEEAVDALASAATPRSGDVKKEG